MSIADQVRELEAKLDAANATIAELRAANTPAKTPAFKVGDRVVNIDNVEHGVVEKVSPHNQMRLVRFGPKPEFEPIWCYARNLRPAPAEQKPVEPTPELIAEVIARAVADPVASGLAPAPSFGGPHDAEAKPTAEKPAEAKVDTLEAMAQVFRNALGGTLDLGRSLANAIDAHIDAKLAAMKGGE